MKLKNKVKPDVLVHTDYQKPPEKRHC